jgi:hypothetical protein
MRPLPVPHLSTQWAAGAQTGKKRLRPQTAEPTVKASPYGAPTAASVSRIALRNQLGSAARVIVCFGLAHAPDGVRSAETSGPAPGRTPQNRRRAVAQGQKIARRTHYRIQNSRITVKFQSGDPAWFEFLSPNQAQTGNSAGLNIDRMWQGKIP